MMGVIRTEWGHSLVERSCDGLTAMLAATTASISTARGLHNMKEKKSMRYCSAPSEAKHKLNSKCNLRVSNEFNIIY